MLLEDAYVLRDAKAVARLYEEGAVLADRHAPQTRGREDIARAAAEAWQRDATFVAAPREVLQAGATALLIGGRSISVARRGPDRAWSYAIVQLERDQEEE